jgi:hypothetical protein
MLVSDLLHSCANERVAEAAVWSISGDFARTMMIESEQRGMSVGALAASMVRRFARDANERDWRDLVDAVRGQDFPVLAGLQLILTKPPRCGVADRDAAAYRVLSSAQSGMAASCGCF